MLVLRCTTKVFKKLGCKPQTVKVSHCEATLGDWYVNTVDYLNDGDLILACIHIESLFIMLVPLQRDMDGHGFATAFLANLLDRLIKLETPPEAAGQIMAAYGGSAILAKNADRKVAGHLNAAIGELYYLLDALELNLMDGKWINLVRIEHRLNYTPRNLSGKAPIWPLKAFWKCVHHLCPELPPRTTISIEHLQKYHSTENVSILRQHLSLYSVSKILAGLNGVDVLFTADELRGLSKSCKQGSDLASALPEFAAEMHRMASFRLERLLDDESA